MKTLNLYLRFYLTIFFLPLAMATYIVISTNSIFQGIISLTVTSVIIWFFNQHLSNAKKENLCFFFNLGFSELKLYGFTFVMNCIFMIIINRVYQWIF